MFILSFLCGICCALLSYFFRLVFFDCLFCYIHLSNWIGRLEVVFIVNLFHV